MKGGAREKVPRGKNSRWAMKKEKEMMMKRFKKDIAAGFFLAISFFLPFYPPP